MSISFPFLIFRLVILSLSLIYLEYDLSNKPIELLYFYKIGYICILTGTFGPISIQSKTFANNSKHFSTYKRVSTQLWKIETFSFSFSISFSFASVHLVSMCVELGICIISMRGSILDTAPRVTIHYWLYSKLGNNIVFAIFLPSFFPLFFV